MAVSWGAGLTAAPDADERLSQVRERRQALERELASLRGQERSLLGEVERLEVEVRLRTEELREAELDLQRTNERMDQTLAQLREREAQVEATRPVLAARARALYRLGELSYLRLLLSVESPSDFFQGYRFVTALARRDRERFDTFRRDVASLSDLRAELEARTQEALELRSRLQASRRRLDANRRRKTELLTSIVEQKETHAAYVAELRDAEQRLQRFLDGLGEEDTSIPITVFRGSLPWPATGRVTSRFGRHRHARFDTYTVQNGIDLALDTEQPVRAVHEGRVVFADRFRGYGLMVVLDHGAKHHTLYAHLDRIAVARGARVAAGDELGSAGSEGGDRELYFEVRDQGRPEDPEQWLE